MERDKKKLRLTINIPFLGWLIIITFAAGFLISLFNKTLFLGALWGALTIQTLYVIGKGANKR